MSASWPELPLDRWIATRDTVHLWTQIVGKVRLALTPRNNHWWNVPLYVNSVGLTTSLMPYQGFGVEIIFDFNSHMLRIQTTRGVSRQLPLQPRTVADFFAEFQRRLDEAGVEVSINPKPVEVVEAIPFADDDQHADYDATAIHDFWLSLVGAHRVFSQFRGEFIGKASPVHFFWGAFDLAVTRFSGRSAPRHPGGVPNCPDWVMTEAYSHEVSSCGYWPGGAAEGVFYSYAYPEPDGFRGHPIRPSGAGYDHDLAEFVLPYADVRAADRPDRHLLEFLRSTYEVAHSLAAWPSVR